jgi:hypothetical protein
MASFQADKAHIVFHECKVVTKTISDRDTGENVQITLSETVGKKRPVHLRLNKDDALALIGSLAESLRT